MRRLSICNTVARPEVAVAVSPPRPVLINTSNEQIKGALKPLLQVPSRAARLQCQPCVDSDWACQKAMANFDPLRNRHPSTDPIPNYCNSWFCRRGEPLYHIWYKSAHSGLCEILWNITNIFYLSIQLFPGTHLQVRRIDGFSRLMAQFGSVQFNV